MLQTIENTTDKIAITLKEITDLIEVRHNDAMRKVEELSKEPDFGSLRKTRIQYVSGKNTTLEMETYIFDKFQAITVGARLNNALLLKVMKRVEELEKQSNKVLTLPEQIQLIAQGYESQNERIEIIEHKIDNEILLTSAQKHNLKQLVNRKVFELIEKHNFPKDFVRTGYMKVWKKLKNHFVVSSYMEIPKVKFEDAVNIVNNFKAGDLI